MGVNGIYGLSGSGLDIESMVKMGMMSKQSQYEKMQQTYTKNEWKKETYLNVYDTLNTYNNSTLSTFKLTGNMNARTATSSNAAIKVTADSSAPTTTHQITVNSTATNAYLIGTADLGTDTKLSSILGNKYTANTDITFYIGSSTDSGVTNGTYANASFSSTALSTIDDATSLLKNALASSIKETSTGLVLSSDNTTLKELSSIDSIVISEASSTVKFTGAGSITRGATSQAYYSISLSKSYNETALSFAVNDGTNNTTVNITYGDLAKVLTNPQATFNDYIKLLNDKFKSNNPTINLTASYSEVNGLTISNTNDSPTDTVTFSLNNAGVGAALNQALYEAADSNTKKLFGDNGSSLTLTADNGKKGKLETSGMKSITIKATDIDTGATVYDLASKINSAGTDIRATYDATNHTFSLYNKNVGEANSVSIVTKDSTGNANANAQNLFNTMGLKKSEGNKDLSDVEAIKFGGDKNVTNYTAVGTNSSVLIDGKKYEGTNSIKANGVTYNISNVTEKTSAVVNVDQDRDKILENVKSFVESYNETLSKLYDMYNETPNSSYTPLTDAQKAEMTEEQIKKWEEKAKSGLLYHDNTIRSIIDQMRSAISTEIDYGNNSSYKYKTAYSIGISTKGLYGQLQLDEEKLLSALNDDPDSVYNVFAKLDTSTNSKVTDSTNGIAQRLGGVMSNALTKITNVAGTSSDISDDSTLSTLLRNLQTRMSNFQSMMNAFENSLYKKYDAMESALASLGTQLNYVSNMFSA